MQVKIRQHPELQMQAFSRPVMLAMRGKSADEGFYDRTLASSFVDKQKPDVMTPRALQLQVGATWR